MGNFHSGHYTAINLYNSKSAEDVNQQSLALNQSDYSGKSRGNEKNHCQVWESPVNFSSRASAEVHDRRKEKNVQKEGTDEGYLSINSHASVVADKASVPFGIQSRPSSSSSGRDQAHADPSSSVPGRFQFQPMGNFRDHAEPDAQTPTMYSQGQELRNQEQGYVRSSQHAGRSVLNNTRAIEKVNDISWKHFLFTVFIDAELGSARFLSGTPYFS